VSMTNSQRQKAHLLCLGQSVAVIAMSKCRGGDCDDRDGDGKRQQRHVGRPIDQETRAGRGADDHRDKHAR
jgi:hypothetical protein